MRFDLTYIDSSGNEFIDHYYYDSINGASNQPTDQKLAGEADLVVVNGDDGNSQKDIAKEKGQEPAFTDTVMPKPAGAQVSPAAAGGDELDQLPGGGTLEEF
mgnify:CR=1 FL=1